MSRARAVHRCVECGAAQPKWAGRCPDCGAWNALVEEMATAPARGDGRAATVPAAPTGAPAVRVGEVPLGGDDATATGLAEVDRVLGGGLVPGSVTLLGGEPGVGKSSLLLQCLAGVAARGGRCLLVSAEESAAQIRRRAERLGAVEAGLWLAAETSLPAVVAHLDAVRPDVVVVDSIQALHHPDVGSAPGSVAQVRESAHALVAEAKQRGCAIVIVGHVTKEGGLAGPRVLEHVVDTVLSFEGDRHHALRLLRAVKHRFGGTRELGVMEMTAEGLQPVPDPSGLFLADRRPGLPGSVVVPTVEGNRPLLVEVQALVCKSALAQPRRSAQGVDGARLPMLLAVLHQQTGLGVHDADVYVSAVGGVRVGEPAADLAVALAVASAATATPLPAHVVACAEIGLGGELRRVSQLPVRLAEAGRLGFSRALVATSADAPGPATVERVATLAEALLAVGVRPPR